MYGSRMYLVLCTLDTCTVLCLRRIIKLQSSASTTYNILRGCLIYVLLSLSNCLYRPWNYPEKGFPRAITLKFLTLFNTTFQRLSSYLLKLPHNPALEGKSLLSLSKLCLSTRSSLRRNRNLHRKT